MPVHVVQQGECMSSLAARFGRSCKEIYEHAANKALRETRPNPNVLAPGDEVVVPDKEWDKKVTCATEEKHRFIVKIPTVKLRIALLDPDGKPFAGKRFVVTVGKKETKGTTTDAGIVEADVRATATSAVLRVWLRDEANGPPQIHRELRIGHVDPVDTFRGVQSRLHNLGYRCSGSDTPPSSRIDDPTVAAIRAFRARVGLPVVEAPPSEDPVDEAKFRAYLDALLDETFRQRLLAAYEQRKGLT